MTAPVPQRETILHALEQLLRWPEIARSPQLSRFLEYIVQRSLAGQEQSIKAYSIAVDVFGRGPDFDPQADPIVRVQARRLRSLLDDYYRGPGLQDALQIRLPIGRYIPDFVVAETEAASIEPVLFQVARASQNAPALRVGPTVSLYVLAVIVLGAAMATYALSTWGPRQQMAVASIGALQRPTINIVEFQNLAADVQPPPQVAGLAIELVTDLEQFENVRAHYRVASELVAAADDLPVNDFVLTGIVRADDELIQYSAILTESRTGSVVWNQTLSVPASEAATPGVLDKVSKSFSLVLGSARGPLHAPARHLMMSIAADEIDTNLYLCQVMFDRYRETGGDSDAVRASACFAALPEVDKQSWSALAANASLLAEYAGPNIAGESTAADRLRLADVTIQRAIALDPISGFVWEQQARLHEGRGNLELARADFAASVQLNPANADALAAFARLLALAGRLTEAEPMAREAAEQSPEPPPWYFGVPTLLALRDGDLARAVESAERYAQADRELGPILAIIAAQRTGDRAVVNRYLPQVLDVSTFRTRGVLPRLRERIGDDKLIDTIRASLSQAGVPWATMTRPF
ncbi:hypothetical protein WH91_15730 [Devosia psychrophila]|uniref:Uncharacterized protein n=1 Tax=Devosia psychrophila TaxID=728005 RepID=A0A0F5PUA2_9HYPH|nr:hypothetical protein WH91_15730 [Devosia psychrophila]SFC33476.1 hypothetical protein SAMN04488059_10421 [Devosia psychrophila]